MTNYVVVLLTNLARTPQYSRPQIVRTVLPAADITDAKALCKSVHGVGYDPRRQAQVCLRLRWSGGNMLVPVDQLHSLHTAIIAAEKDLDVNDDRPMKVQHWQGEAERRAAMDDEEFVPEDPRH